MPQLQELLPFLVLLPPVRPSYTTKASPSHDQRFHASLLSPPQLILDRIRPAAGREGRRDDGPCEFWRRRRADGDRDSQLTLALEDERGESGQLTIIMYGWVVSCELTFLKKVEQDRGNKRGKGRGQGRKGGRV